MLSRFWKIFVIISIVGLSVSAIFYFLWFYPTFQRSNLASLKENSYLIIPTGASFSQVTDSLVLSGALLDKKSFITCSERLGYPSKIKPGKYKLESGWNNLTLVRHLRSGNQQPVRLTINNVRTLEELAGKIAGQIEPDSLALLEALIRLRTYDNNIPFGEDSTMCLFVPNTYEIWWNTSPAQLFERMWEENKRFWNAERQRQAANLGLTTTQVYILASIIEKETLVQKEKPTIAGVYLNRLKSGILLQADPTVVFAKKAFDKERILFSDLTYDSPYNTYMYGGLPPGPICMPEIRTIDAALNPENHDYLYFCAKADNSGAHAFAKTLAAHNENARRFQAWMNSQGIFR
jgi:UPF0755 protein